MCIQQREIGLNESMNVAREFECNLRKERERCMYVYNIVARTLRARAPIFPCVLCMIVHCAFMCVLCLPPPPWQDRNSAVSGFYFYSRS